MPPLVHLFYVNSSEFEERETYYFRCYAISTASVEVKWMFKYCPSGNPICEGSYEQLVVRVFNQIICCYFDKILINIFTIFNQDYLWISQKNTQQDTSKTQYDMLITDVYINVNETGTLLCNASNSFGNSVEEYTITGTSKNIIIYCAHTSYTSFK